jgi:enoyl-CoA hydratase/carnithine racemase
MTDKTKPSPEEILLYEKDPATKIATITLNRPDQLNAPTIGTRLRYARLLDQANVDDDVKVLVVRGAGDDFGTGADLPELAALMAESPDAALREELQLNGADVTYPPARSYRASATLGQWYADPRSGCRSLQDFKKISIVEVKGYCYGWHFYQAADADLVIASDDSLFGHPAFRYVGWGPRMWAWAMTMGIRKFQEMVFTGRPFTAKEMYDCSFVNSVVTRDDLEAEVAKYASACSRSRPTDAVVMQKAFFQMMKQYQGEYMGSLLSAFLEGMGARVRPDGEDLMLGHEVYESGLNKAVKSNDHLFPPEFRLSKTGRADKSGRNGKSGRADKSGRAGKSERAGKSGRPHVE